MNPQNIADSIVQTVREPLVVLDSELRVAAVNRALTARSTLRLTRPRVVYFTNWATANGTSSAAEHACGCLLSNSEFNDYEVA